MKFATSSFAAAAVLLLSISTFGQPSPKATPRSGGSKPTVSKPGALLVERGMITLSDEATLASDRPGILAFVEPKEGAKVKAKQKLAGLKDEVAVAALRVAEETAKNDIEIRYAEKAAEVAEAEHKKALQANIRVPTTLPEVEVERLRLSAERAQLQIEKAELDMIVAKAQRDEKAAELATYEILCPLDGVVTRVLKHQGEAVQQGDPILRVVRTDVVRVEGYVHAVDALRMKLGDPVSVKFGDEGGIGALDVARLPERVRDRTFEGKIGFIDVTASPTTYQVRVWAEVANEGNLLLAGLPVQMEVMPASETAAAAAESRK